MRRPMPWLVLCLALAAPLGAAVAVPPRPDRYATDRAGVIDAARLAALNERLAQFERETSNQVLVYLDRRLPAGTTLEEWSNAAFNAWSVGQKGKDNGVAVFVFVDDRKVRFEVGYGLEGAIPDARTVRIREDYMAPRFRAGDYAGGIEQAVQELMKAARGEPYKGTGQTVAEGVPSGPLAWWVWLIPLVGAAVGWRVARGADDSSAMLVRGGGTFVFVTGFLSMIAAPVSGDARTIALGFGVILLGLAGFLAWMIGRDTSKTGRRRVGIGLLQGGAGLMVGGFGLLCFAAVWASFAGWGGRALLYGLLALIVGGFVQSDDPVRTLTVAFGRLLFVTFAISGVALGAVRFFEGYFLRSATDWVVVSGLLWLMVWTFARSRGYTLYEAPAGGWSSYSGSGRSSGFSWSSSSGSSWSSSSSSSGSSFSGGGGRSGGGGSSGSW
ncbi:MAG TPA: TPM domain-containing protein [Vicinamibacteria bacterium]|nr:TPM domain-containing protein [Vicinamibacteria bacterium]